MTVKAYHMWCDLLPDAIGVYAGTSASTVRYQVLLSAVEVFERVSFKNIYVNRRPEFDELAAEKWEDGATHIILGWRDQAEGAGCLEGESGRVWYEKNKGFSSR